MVNSDPQKRIRVSKLREKLFVTPAVSIDKAYWYTESLKETEGQPQTLRRAKANAKVLEMTEKVIGEDELLVGRLTSEAVGGILCPEDNIQWIIPELDTIHTREWEKCEELSEENKQTLREIAEYWKGKSLYDKWIEALPQRAKELYNIIHVGGAYCANGFNPGHSFAHYEKVLKVGLNGLLAEINQKQIQLDWSDPVELKKYWNYAAWKINLEALIDYANKYAELANTMSISEKDPKRKAELVKIAEICRKVPANPAESFWEALQSCWFVYVGYMLENTGNGVGFGRMDQYLYPYYQQDVEKGVITREDARELIALFNIRINAVSVPLAGPVCTCFGGRPLTCNINIGGVNKDGDCAVNELSYIFLDAQEDTALRCDDIVVRINKNTPDEFISRVLDVAIKLKGKLKWVGDKTIIKQLVVDGKPIEMARDYSVDGCYQPTVGGKSHDVPAGSFNLPLALELALNNGVSRMLGKQIGPETGDPRQFKTYEEVWEAYKKQVEALLPYSNIYKYLDWELRMNECPMTFASPLLEGCIEKGLDILEGGTAPYTTQTTQISGLPNVGDALAAVKKLVFEEKKITMVQLIDALDNNFDGDEAVLRLLDKAPKFGNDDPYVDSIVNEALVMASDIITSAKGVGNVKTTASAATVTMNLPLGAVVGALPDGRRAGEPIAEGGISPQQGRNKSGLTPTLNSVSRLDHMKITGGSVLNIKLNPSTLKSDDKRAKMVAAIRTFFEMGGGLLQFNIVDVETLKNAQKNPQDYKDLLVRVATYSAYFTELSSELQSDIIARMEINQI